MRTMGEQMAISFAHHDITAPRHGGNDLTRFERKNLVGVAVEEEQRSAA